ncbi:hypothetical protein NC651_004836 [Populus alba x Populus x berolinensis]|nr:hypothetical protein NC651_004836 [Populus alba x Populus x berolinensis]
MDLLDHPLTPSRRGAWLFSQKPSFPVYGPDIFWETFADIQSQHLLALAKCVQLPSSCVLLLSVVAFQLRTSPLSCCLSDIFLLPASSVLASFSGLVAAPHIFSIELFFHNASILLL